MKKRKLKCKVPGIQRVKYPLNLLLADGKKKGYNSELVNTREPKFKYWDGNYNEHIQVQNGNDHFLITPHRPDFNFRD